jgi:dTDP-4-dehydrorhamnose 3,5-epimerase
MKLTPAAIPDVVVIDPLVLNDGRGWFMESFNEQRFAQGLAALGLPPAAPFVQDNHSCSHRGVLRGLHYQHAPHAQGKLVRVIQGAVFDVVVDLRPMSATYGRWIGHELSAGNRRQLWIPPGFAHGFLSLEDDTQVLYKVTDYHVPSCEGAIAWNDPALAIAWPRLDVQPQVSDKDAAAPNWPPRT